MCTNVKEGLRCDGCVERNKKCSRERDSRDQGIIDTRADTASEESSKEDDGGMRSCALCKELHQFCDGVEPSCALCIETGLSCKYPEAVASNLGLNTEQQSSTLHPTLHDISSEQDMQSLKGKLGEDQDDEMDLWMKDDSKSRAERRGKDSVVRAGKTDAAASKEKQSEVKEEEEEDWEEISTDEAFGVLKNGELAVMELD
jgi:hypothetical protein